MRQIDVPFFTLLWSAAIVLTSVWTQTNIELEDFNETRWKKKIFETYKVVPRNINVGMLLAMSQYESQEENSRLNGCGYVRDLAVLTQAYAVWLQANRSTLGKSGEKGGYVIADTCDRESAAIQQTRAFVPRKRCVKQCNTDKLAYSSFDIRTPPFNVVSMVGAPRVLQTTLAGKLFRALRLPMLSYSHEAFGDNPVLSSELKNVTGQYELLSTFFRHFNWTYVLVVYWNDEYGTRGRDAFQQSAKKKGIVAKYIKVEDSASQELINHTAETIISNRRAAVVLVIINKMDTVRQLVQATTSKLRQMKKHILWVGDYSWGVNFDSLGIEGFADAFIAALSPLQRRTEKGDLDLKAAMSIPWFDSISARMTFCHSQSKTFGSHSCPYTFMGRPDDIDQTQKNVNLLVALAVKLVFGIFNDLLTAGDCLKADCFKPIDILKSFISLNSSDLTKIEHKIFQLYLDKNSRLRSKTVEQTFKNISWTSGVPVSRCHEEQDCQPKQYLAYYSDKCHECTPCKETEIPTSDRYNCSRCPDMQWYVLQNNSYICTFVTEQGLYDCLSGNCISKPWMVQALVVLACLGLCACAVVLACYIYFRKHPIIKASSLDLSCVMLMGIVLGYTHLLLILQRPSPASCVFKYFLLFTAFSLIYAAMLVRAVRIYRIFRAGQQTNLKMIKPLSQIVISLLIVFLQQIICLVCYLLCNDSKVWQYQKQDKAVYQNICAIPIKCMSAGISFCVIESLLCVLLAYKTRDLPDRFNEVRWMISCVATTFVTTVAFNAIYQTNAQLEELVRALVLAVNITFALIFLFLPKAYSVATSNIVSMSWSNSHTINLHMLTGTAKIGPKNELLLLACHSPSIVTECSRKNAASKHLLVNDSDNPRPNNFLSASTISSTRSSFTQRIRRSVGPSPLDAADCHKGDGPADRSVEVSTIISAIEKSEGDSLSHPVDSSEGVANEKHERDSPSHPDDSSEGVTNEKHERDSLSGP
jgi:hypothetical protein